MLRNLKNKGFASIVEVIVTAMVFTVAAFGILSTVTMFQPQTEGSSRKMEAAYIGKGVIDDLRRQVSAEDWDTGSLVPGTYQTTVGIYTVDYVITEPFPDLRYLTMTVTWPDP